MLIESSETRVVFQFTENAAVAAADRALVKANQALRRIRANSGQNKIFYPALDNR